MSFDGQTKRRQLELAGIPPFGSRRNKEGWAKPASPLRQLIRPRHAYNYTHRFREGIHRASILWSPPATLAQRLFRAIALDTDDGLGGNSFPYSKMPKIGPGKWSARRDALFPHLSDLPHPTPPRMHDPPGRPLNPNGRMML